MVEMARRNPLVKHAPIAAAALALGGAGIGGSNIVSELAAISRSTAATASDLRAAVIELRALTKALEDHEKRLRDLEKDPIAHGFELKKLDEIVRDFEGRLRVLELKVKQGR